MSIPNSEGAVDLAQIKKRADERDAAEAAAREADEQERIEERVQAWDRSMRRAFKGILPAPERRRFLMRATDA